MVSVERFPAQRGPVRTLARDEIYRLLAGQPETAIGLRNRVMLAFMYDTGVRAAELARLRLKDLDLARGQAEIQGKNRFFETVHLSPALRAELAEYLARRPQTTQAPFAEQTLFVSRAGVPMTTNAMRLWMRRAKVRAGINGKRVSPHVIRASAATHFAEAGVSAFGVQRFLRHRTSYMSLRYVDLASLELAKLHAHASPLQRLTDAHPQSREVGKASATRPSTHSSPCRHG
jgi:integrase/recombinase XerD